MNISPLNYSIEDMSNFVLPTQSLEEAIESQHVNGHTLFMVHYRRFCCDTLNHHDDFSVDDLNDIFRKEYLSMLQLACEGSQEWHSFSTEMKQSWKEHAISLNACPIKGEFKVLPTELGQGVTDLESVLRH